MGKLRGVGLYHFSVIILYVSSTMVTYLGASNLTVGCFENERLALLKFKHSVTDYSNKLSYWVGSDCCRWFGVRCDSATGHVVSLHLRGNIWDGIDLHGSHNVFMDEHFSNNVDYLDISLLAGSEINFSLAELRYLKYLDLSGNDFKWSMIPEFIGSLKQLKYLNLSYGGFCGIIPPHLGNLSKLNVLDLGSNLLIADDMSWVSGMSSLEHLDLSEVKFSQTQILEKLLYFIPSLVELHLSQCELFNVGLDSFRLNSSTMLPNIKQLDLSWNYFGSFPHFLQNMTSLVSLDLSGYDLSHPHRFETLLNSVPSLSELHLRNCLIYSTKSFTIHVNFSKISHIQHLDLSDNSIKEKFPAFLINMSSLGSLDLSDNFLNSSVPDIPNLLTLDLSYNNFNNIWHVGIWKRCHLKYLRVDHNKFQGEMIDPSTNMSECSRYALKMLDLSVNQINGSIPESLAKLTDLETLYLNSNQLTGFIPDSIGKLIALERLSLEWNKLSGHIPESVGRLVSLQKFTVSSNLLNGSIPASTGNLTKLVFFDVSNNSLEGIVSETHFANLLMLDCLDATSNFKLIFNISPEWTPPFQARIIRMGSCTISSEFPQWLRTQKNLMELVLSNSSLTGTLPIWMQKMPIIPRLDLSHNQLSGPLTNLPVSELYNNDGKLYLNNNLFNGLIPKSLCKWTYLGILNLSQNRLSGKIPKCLENLLNLRAMVFNSNKLSGAIPGFIGNMTYSVTWLNLNNNSLTGELPISLGNFLDLRVLDFGANNLSGSIPKWIGEKLIHLVVLRLNKNHFAGRIPPSLCYKVTLQILDIAHNNITGSIPSCFKELSGMVRGSHESVYNNTDRYNLDITQVIKGANIEYTTNLQFVVNMDLSSNKLAGEIPKELTTLYMLVGLNLSNNNLSGCIPDSIGNMKALFSLDFSQNKLTGIIPSSMSSLNFLTHLNLSNNNLSGRIPTGNQLQTLTDPSIYTGNIDLCGAPLPKNCSNHDDPKPTINKEADESKKVWFYLDIMSGFATGFWGIIGVLVFKKQWRQKLFAFSQVTIDNMYVAVVVRVPKMKRGKETI